MGGFLKQALLRAGRAIDAVHDDGALPKVPVDASPDGNKAGVYVSIRGVPERIGILRSGPWPTYTAIHETAHFLCEQALGEPGLPDEAQHGDFSEFRQAKEPEELPARAA